MLGRKDERQADSLRQTVLVLEPYNGYHISVSSSGNLFAFSFGKLFLWIKVFKVLFAVVCGLSNGTHNVQAKGSRKLYHDEEYVAAKYRK